MTTKQSINLALKIIGSTGFSGVTVSAPNALLALILILKKGPANLGTPERILAELKRQGLVHVSNDGNKWHFTLSPAGIHRLQQVIIDEIAVPRPRSWDGKWRMVAFDVPTNHSKQRKYFTAHLQRLGFYMLQKSMWVHPFPSFGQVEQVAAHYNVLRYCTMVEINRLDELSAKRLLKHFNHILS
jgi:DNA-binding transcriptional regulator PaaX